MKNWNDKDQMESFILSLDEEHPSQELLDFIDGKDPEEPRPSLQQLLDELEPNRKHKAEVAKRKLYEV